MYRLRSGKRTFSSVSSQRPQLEETHNSAADASTLSPCTHSVTSGNIFRAGHPAGCWPVRMRMCSITSYSMRGRYDVWAQNFQLQTQHHSSFQTPPFHVLVLVIDLCVLDNALVINQCGACEYDRQHSFRFVDVGSDTAPARQPARLMVVC